MNNVSQIAKATTRPPPTKATTAAAQSRIVEAESRERDKLQAPFAGALEAILGKWARVEAARAKKLIERHGLNPKAAVAKALISKAGPTRSSLQQELIDLYMRFGLQQVEETGSRWSARLGGKFILRPQVKEEYALGVENKVVLLFEDTERQVRESLQGIITGALAEEPRPSVGEVRRRISNQWHGEPTQEEIERGSAAERRVTAEWRRRERAGLPPGPGVRLAREHIREGEQESLFSPARAWAIARTELGDADTAGAAEGFAASGVERVGWGARPNDGRSGKREHWKMNKHPAISIEDIQSSNPSRWFRLPNGDRGRRPMDPALPVGQRVNCRCALLPRR